MGAQRWESMMIRVTAYDRRSYRKAYETECVAWWEATAVEDEYRRAGYEVSVVQVVKDSYRETRDFEGFEI